VAFCGFLDRGKCKCTQTRFSHNFVFSSIRNVTISSIMTAINEFVWLLWVKPNCLILYNSRRATRFPLVESVYIFTADRSQIILKLQFLFKRHIFGIRRLCTKRSERLNGVRAFSVLQPSFSLCTSFSRDDNVINSLRVHDAIDGSYLDENFLCPTYLWGRCLGNVGTHGGTYPTNPSY
jgi:hypothetical protein